MDWLEVAKTAAGPLSGAITGLAGSLLGLKKRMEAVEKKVGRHATTLQGHAALHAVVSKDVEELREQLNEYQSRHSEFAKNVRDSSVDFADQATLANFIAENQAQWQTFERTLGRIEGHLGLGPAPQVPRPLPRPSNRTPPPFPTDYRDHPHTPRRK